jgi:hypothetical protein
MRLLLRAILFLAAATLALADPTAILTGFITDPHSAAVPGAKITVVNLNTGVQYTVESNGVGLYNTPPLEPGVYRMTIGKDGFKTIVKTGVELHVQDTISVNFGLEVGSVSESVTVEAGASPINTTDATVSMTVSRDLVENLPLNGRSFQQLITLAPGVNLTSAQNTGDRGEFSVNGQRPTSNYFTVDGVGANLGSFAGVGAIVGSSESLNAAGGTNSLVSVDALQEFRILTSSFAPEYGRTPGGQVILLTRSGTNSFHGTLFEYFRNDVLDANDWFANQAGAPRAALRFNDYGGTLGGPIIKNETFFFFSYEGQPLRQPQFTITSVPDVASRQAAPAAVQPLLNGFPVPNGPELGNGLAEFSAGYSNPINSNATSLRVDHVFGPKLSAFARYNYAPSSSEVRGGLGTALSDVVQTSYQAQSITAGLTYAISPTVVNETRVNWSENLTTSTLTLDNFGGATNPPTSTLFLPSYSAANYLANVEIGDVEFNDGSQGGIKPRQVNLVDGLSYTVGAHQLKFGVDYLRSLPILPFYSTLYYYFDSVPDAVSNNNLSFGNFVQYPVRADITNLSLYAQDTWRASRRLTLTYGLRWDLNPPPSDRYPNNGNYVPLLGNYATGDVTVGAAGSSLWNTQYKNFSPRLGLAYQFRQTPGRETILRAGIGLFYDVAEEGAASVFGEDFETSPYIYLSGLSFPVSPATAAVPPISLTNPAPGSEFLVYPRNFAAPRVWQWNVSIQQALGSAQTLTVSYVAALGQDLLYDQLYPSVGPNDYYVFLTGNSASSNYQSLQLQYQRGLSHGVTAMVTYDWSHSLDDASTDFGALPPVADLSARDNWGPSDFDIRHSFKAAFSWSVPTPSGARWVRAIAGGWGADGIITARSALPVDITDSYNVAFGRYAFRPNIVPGQPIYLHGSQYPEGKAFNPAAFVINPNAQGDLGRNSLRGFDLAETDLSLRRTFSVTERLRLLFRADLFNLFNHPNFANPDAGLADGTFGQSISMANGVLGGSSQFSQNSVFQTGGPRTVQFSLKLQF